MYVNIVKFGIHICMMNHKLKIASMNVRGLADPVKRNDVFDWLKQQDISICCLQDVHFKAEMHQLYQDEWGFKCEICSYSSEKRGVAVLFKKGLDVDIKDIKGDEQGNLLILEVNVNDNPLMLINLYGPNKDNPSFYENLKSEINKRDDIPLVLCGDWNLVLDQNNDTRGYKERIILKLEMLFMN